MKLNVKFINARPYDFTDNNGKRIVGCNIFVYDFQSKEILKVKVVNPASIEGKKFGDDITINCIPHGRYLNYEV